MIKVDENTLTIKYTDTKRFKSYFGINGVVIEES